MNDFDYADFLRKRIDCLDIPLHGKSIRQAGLHTVIRSILSGSIPSATNWERVCAFLGISIRYETSDDDGGSLVDLPIHGYCGADSTAVLLPDDHVHATTSAPGMRAGLIGLEIRGDSMYPVYNSGDIVFVDNRVYLPDQLDGRHVLAELADGGGAFLKGLRLAGSGNVILESINPMHPPMIGVTLARARPVRWVKRR